MVEQRAALQEHDSRGSRLLPLLLVLGGGLVLWWTLMTGTAHAAEAPVAPVHHVTHDLVRTVTRTVTTPVRTTVARTAPKAVAKQAVVKAVSTPVTTPHLAASEHAEHAVHAGRPGRLHAPRAVHAQTPHTALHTRVGGSTSEARASRHGSAPLRQADVPADSPDRGPDHRAPPGPGGSTGSGSGPAPAALVEHTRTPELHAASERSTDTRQDLPVEPAYLPGCSPD